MLLLLCLRKAFMQIAINNTILQLESAVFFLNSTASARGWERHEFQTSKVSR